jgi:hypothetical protein
MDEETLRKELQHFINTARADIEQLSDIAEKLALEEYETLKEKGWAIPPTTNREGNGYDPETPVHSRFTVPLAMVCFSVIDFSGQIIRQDNLYGASYKQNDFLEHARNFFDILAGRDDLKNGQASHNFQDIYRHAMMHAYLPVATNGIAYSVSYSYYINPNTLFSDHFTKQNILNVKYLAEITKEGLIRLEQMLENEKERQGILSNYAIFLERQDQKNR